MDYDLSLVLTGGVVITKGISLKANERPSGGVAITKEISLQAKWTIKAKKTAGGMSPKHRIYLWGRTFEEFSIYILLAF